MTTIVERQHYVWRRYLAAWCVGDTVWCSRFKEGKFFASNPINLAVERYFYELTDLTDDDIKFIQSFVNRATIPGLKELNTRWVEQYNLLFNLVRLARTLHADKADVQAQITTLLTQIEEQALAHVEGESTVFLDALIAGDVSFFDNPDQASKFLIFLMQQYFRTKKIRDGTLNVSLPGVLNVDLERAWPVFRHVFATNVGAGLFARRATMKPCVVEAPDGMEFITGDQPIINTYAGQDPKAMVQRDEYFYPVSPRRALLLSENVDTHALHGSQVSALRAHVLNDMMANAAHEQRFASRRESLETHQPKAP